MIPTSLVVVLLIIIAFPLALILFTRRRVAGRMLCWFLEEDKTLSNKLLKVDGEFVQSGDDHYRVDVEKVRLIRYPFGMPSVLQQIIPTSLYQAGASSFEPLDWITLSNEGASAKEVGAILDPYWMGNLMKAVKEGGGETRFQRMLPWLTLGIAAISLILVFVLLTRLGSIQSSVAGLEALLK